MFIIPKGELSSFHHAANQGDLELIGEFIEVQELSVDEADEV